MTHRYLLLDLANIFHRARWAVERRDRDEQIGMCMHIVFNGIQKCWREHKSDHLVVCAEGRSWRKDFYSPYKRNRSDVVKEATLAEQQSEQHLWDAMAALLEFFATKTNVTILQNPRLEADDLIAGWIQNHPEDHHTIISSDSDFMQLLSSNVVQYNGVTDELYTVEGIFDGRGKQVLDKKTKQPKTTPDPSWLLFEKCIRGDSSDNVFSAYPGVRKKGSKNKVGIEEAYADRSTQGFAWNNFMLQTWTDHEGTQHTVRDDYQRNVTLIDLSAQPEDVRKIINETVTSTIPQNRQMIGAYFLRFCGKYDLVKLSENSNTWSTILSAALPERVL